MKGILVRLAWHVVFMVMALTIIMIAKKIDQSIPVVTNFNVTSQIRTEHGIIIEGTMDKSRACEFVEVLAYAKRRPVPVTFLDRPIGTPIYSRAVRVQLWGPWDVASGDAKTIVIYARHKCHIFWDNTTELNTLNVIGEIPK
jgi:hypothetical protein